MKIHHSPEPDHEPATQPLIDLADPVWTIAHVARCFGVSIDRAREYTSREDFPAARRLGVTRGRLLWPREEVLAWFVGLPGVKASERRYHRPAPPAPAPVKPTRSSYRPRSQRAAGEAA